MSQEEKPHSILAVCSLARSVMDPVFRKMQFSWIILTEALTFFIPVPAAIYKVKGLDQYKKAFQISGVWPTDDSDGARLNTNLWMAHCKLWVKAAQHKERESTPVANLLPCGGTNNLVGRQPSAVYHVNPSDVAELILLHYSFTSRTQKYIKEYNSDSLIPAFLYCYFTAL